MATKHAVLSPSSSKRWINCRASVGFIQKNRHLVPPEGPSPHADEGTAAHLFGEQLLLGQRVPRPKSSEMVACIEDGYVPFVREQAKRCGINRIRPEQTIPLFYDKTMTGTCDAPLLGDDLIVIIDLKYGAGVSVEAKNNPQLAIYGESAIRASGRKYRDSTPVELVIYQPRAQDNRFVRRWSLTRGDLREFTEHITEAAHSILMDPEDQPFMADPETICRWCPAKAFCSHYAGALLGELPPEVAKPLSSPEQRLHLPNAGKMSESQMLKLIRAKRDIIDWIEEVEAHILNQMLKGQKVQGFKIAEGRKNKVWRDEKEAKRLLSRLFPNEELVTSSFKSPAAIGEMLKALRKQPEASLLDKINKLIHKPPGDPRLAVRDDPAAEYIDII